MNAEILRRAVALMRERAEAASPGPWSGADEHGDLPGADPAWCISRMRPGYESMSEVEGYMYDVAEITHEDDRSEADCHHIASWHPDVALAVARSLDQHVNEHDAYDCNWGDDCASLALARTYLGEQA